MSKLSLRSLTLGGVRFPARVAEFVPTAPGKPAAPVGTPVGWTGGFFTFSTPSSGGSPLLASEFRWSLDESAWTVLEDPDQPVVIGEIDPETTVYGQSRFLNAVGWGEWSDSGTFVTLEEVLPPNPPARPDAPVGVATGTTTGEFTFVEPEDDGGAEITANEFRYIEPEGEWVVIEDAVSPVELDDLDPEATIYAEVRFLNSAGWSEWSESGSFTTDAEEPEDTVPAQPNAPVGTATGYDTGTFTFTEPFDGGSAITDVEFRVSTDEFDWSGVESPVSPIVLEGLQAETAYYAQVRFANVLGWGPWSVSGFFTTEVEPRAPGQPDAPVGAATGPTSGTFTFGPPTDTGTSGIVAWQLRHSYDQSTWTVIDDPISPRTLTGLTPDSAVYAQVRYQNDVDWGPWSTSGTFDTEAEVTAPAKPATPGVTVTGQTTATVTFVEPDDGGSEITDVELRISTDESTWDDVPDPVSPEDLTGLTPATGYFAQVRFANVLGWGPWSDSAEFQTEAEAEPVLVMSLEFDTGDYEIDGETVALSGIGFDRSTVAYYFSGNTPSGAINEAAVDAPVVKPDGMLLRSSLAQLLIEPAVPANFTNSNTATHADAGISYSGIAGREISAGGTAAARSGRGTGGSWTNGQPYRVYWIYKMGSASSPRFYVINGSGTCHITVTSGTPSVTQQAGGNTLTDVGHYELDAANGIWLLSALYTPTSSSGFSSVGMGPNATSGSVIGFGINALPTSDSPDFDKLQHTRAAETFMPPLPDGTYDLLIVGPNDAEEWRYGVVWESGAWDTSAWTDENEDPQTTSPTVPIAGQDRIKKIFAYTQGGEEPDPPSEPGVASAPSGAASSDSSGTFTFAQPADNGGAEIIEAELRHSDDEADWTTISPAASPQAITGLPAETLIYGQVRFRNSVGWGPWSASGTFTTLAEEEEPEGEPWSIWGFQRPATPPTEFPGSLIVGDEQDATDASKYIIQSNDPAITVGPGITASGAQTTARYAGYVDEDAMQVGDRIAVIAEIAAASGNVAITSNTGNSSNSSNNRLGHKQGVLTGNAAVPPRMSVTFNAGVSGHVARLRAYNLRILMARPWFITFTAGQSNGVCSVATADPAIDTPIEGVVVFPGLTNPYTGAQADQPMIAVEPIQHQTLNGSASAYGGGPMGECLRELRKRIPEEFLIVCVPLNWAGQGFKANGYWNKESADPRAYNGFWSKLRAVWAQAPAGSIMGSFFFCGGESDLGGANLTAWASLTTGFPALINEVRAEPGWGEVPVVIMEIGMDNTQSNVQAMIALQQRLATGSGDALEFTRCRYVPRPAGWVTVDGTHYDQATHRQRGLDAALALLDIIYDGAPPPDEGGGEVGDFSDDFNEDFS